MEASRAQPIALPMVWTLLELSSLCVYTNAWRSKSYVSPEAGDYDDNTTVRSLASATIGMHGELATASASATQLRPEGLARKHVGDAAFVQPTAVLATPVLPLHTSLHAINTTLAKLPTNFTTHVEHERNAPRSVQAQEAKANQAAEDENKPTANALDVLSRSGIRAPIRRSLANLTGDLAAHGAEGLVLPVAESRPAFHALGKTQGNAISATDLEKNSTANTFEAVSRSGKSALVNLTDARAHGHLEQRTRKVDKELEMKKVSSVVSATSSHLDASNGSAVRNVERHAPEDNSSLFGSNVAVIVVLSFLGLAICCIAGECMLRDQDKKQKERRQARAVLRGESSPGESSQSILNLARQRRSEGSDSGGYRAGDLTRGILERGKMTRGGSEDDHKYHFGDFTRGLTSTVGHSMHHIISAK